MHEVIDLTEAEEVATMPCSDAVCLKLRDSVPLGHSKDLGDPLDT